jgi:hypothetical protein
MLITTGSGGKTYFKGGKRLQRTEERGAENNTVCWAHSHGWPPWQRAPTYVGGYLRHHRNLRKSMEAASNLRQRNPMTDEALHRQLTTCIDDEFLLRPLTSYKTRVVVISCSLEPAPPPS